MEQPTFFAASTWKSKDAAVRMVSWSRKKSDSTSPTCALRDRLNHEPIRWKSGPAPLKVSGQIDELAAISNAARGGAKAAQATADAAVAGVNQTNERISALDDYVPQGSAAVNFRIGSAMLSPAEKSKLDAIATKALNSKGYVLEVTGHADSTGKAERNRVLSQRRADAVIRYLVEQHKIPLRRIITPYGFGASEPIADNRTREGRAQNRRVEVKILVNKGLTQPAPTINPGSGQ
jgi:outer membrane protein OmpA-like peptidoglycan-associated protein